MSIREGAGRRVAFDTRKELGDKIDKLMVMVGKLIAKDSNRKPEIHKSRRPPGQNRGYSHRSYKNRTRLYNRLNSMDRGQFRQDRG